MRKIIRYGVAGYLIFLTASYSLPVLAEDAANPETAKQELQEDRQKIKADKEAMQDIRKSYRDQITPLKEQRRQALQAGNKEQAKTLSGQIQQLKKERREKMQGARKQMRQDRREFREERREHRQQHRHHRGRR